MYFFCDPLTKFPFIPQSFDRNLHFSLVFFAIFFFTMFCQIFAFFHYFSTIFGIFLRSFNEFVFFSVSFDRNLWFSRDPEPKFKLLPASLDKIRILLGILWRNSCFSRDHLTEILRYYDKICVFLRLSDEIPIFFPCFDANLSFYAILPLHLRFSPDPLKKFTFFMQSFDKNLRFLAILGEIMVFRDF